jgi:hypothetical protein
MSKLNYDVPFDQKVTAKDDISHPWQNWAGQVGTAMNKLSQSAQTMPTLTGASTLADVIAAYEAFRVKIQGIV